MKSSITIREVEKPVEIPLLNSIYWQEYEKGNLRGVVPPLSRKEILENNYFFIMHDNKIIGAFGLLKFSNLPIKYKDEFHFMRLLIISEYRDKGFFRDVHALVLERAKILGARILYSRVHPSNEKMLRILEKLGWEQIEIDSVKLSEIEKNEKLYAGIIKLIGKKSEGKDLEYKDMVLRKEL